MIITQKKPMEELMAMVGDAKTVAIVGCNSCATACHTGGEPEVAALAKALEEAGKKVVGTTIADYCCMNLGVKGKMKPLVAAKPDCVICMSCGDGVQCVAKNAPGIPTYPSNNTMYLGEAVRFGVWEEACHFCGDCVLGQTGGICPVTQCAKSLVNGPAAARRTASAKSTRKMTAHGSRSTSVWKRSVSSISSASPVRTRATRSSAIRERSA